ncbi:protein mono-ADP-ribosyltransferase PARP3 isoform X1 [Rhinoderma darwinii]|uniref:protein mono-ADP-ribosyltransferase PARP3 isoform X1 n=1 Tax=Rhinoderma darwinii TaxID=43563 RepID=UPI003F6676B0
MAPKRKAAAKGSGKGKKVKVKAEVKEEEKEEAIQAPDRFQSAVQALKASTGKKGKAKIDAACSVVGHGNTEVYEDYDCMLNQTNIGNNNNKFYIIQLLHGTDAKQTFYCWNRWGRVGEIGQSKLNPFSDLNSAKKDFEKKFKDKTKNNWSDRENFTPHPGKYTMIEVEHDDDDEEGTGEAMVKVDTVDGVCKKVRPCSLDKPTQDLVSLIFNSDMFKDAMQTMNLDIKKMPLGKLSKAQIAKGFDALEELQAALDRKAAKKNLSELSSRFYTIIPHNFGRQTPPIIDSLEVLQAKKDMLLVLADIELAQTLQADKVKQEKEVELAEVPHPLDVDYQLLKCQLCFLEPKSEEFKVIDTYVKHTGPSYRQLKILNVWRVDREAEEERLSAHKDIDNRRLLWHGTNVAVVAAILKSGLRIMPHSGGRVGRGIYFASENSKSAGYVGVTSSHLGIMFLNEVALGKEHHITQDDSSLRSAPKGYDSVVARGTTEPDPSLDHELLLDGRKIIVPQGKPINVSKYKNSCFSQSEYLVYKESQARMRYLLLLQF